MQILEILAQRKFISADCPPTKSHKTGKHRLNAIIKIVTEMYLLGQYLSIDLKKFFTSILKPTNGQH